MSCFRGFSSSEKFPQDTRSIDSDAPVAMRNELIDLIFNLVEHNSPPLSERIIYNIICQSLGNRASGDPYGGFRYAAGRDLCNADWQRVYDLICRLWPEYDRFELSGDYKQDINRILAANRVVWELTEEGQLRRYLPSQAQTLVNSVIVELNNPRFEPALELLNIAMDAYNGIPRRDRDACANIFDSMESVAKIINNMPTSTFGDVLLRIRGLNTYQNDTINILDKINTLRNHHFGHGMTNQFSLSPTEVDFIYLTCFSSILLFVQSYT